MSFFNNKEEVISIELTQYGKLMFSKGIFEPIYYSFFDDDIIYDSSYANLSESQNDIETRILEQAIYKKPLYNLKGAESNLQNQLAQNLKSYELENSIGKVDSINQYVPSWEIRILNGTSISSSLPYKEVFTSLSGSKKTVNIPQINLNSIPVKVNITNNNKPNINFDVITKNVLLQIEELNVITEKENFEIEFFEIEGNDSVGNEKLNQIYFIERPIYVKDGLLLDNPTFSKVSANSDDSVVEYYFDINADVDFDQNLLKKIIDAEKQVSKNIKE